MSGLVYDLAIIGGGINGVSIARDAAGRGLSVFLCEQDDLGSAASSATSGLLHGGFRDPRTFAFSAVREAQSEREILLRAAPHVVQPMRLVVPHRKGLRARIVHGASLFARDHIGGRQMLPPARALDLESDEARTILREDFRSGVEYSVCWVDDARLVILNALDARVRGASINPGLRCVIAEREGRTWRLSLESRDGEAQSVVLAKTLVNAAGPWAGDVINHIVHGNRTARVRLVKGSHIVVPRLFDGPRGFVFWNAGGGPVFALPYEDDFTLIGTSEEEFHGDPGDVAPDSAEIAFLTTTISAYLRRPVYEDQIVWSFSGVRPILDQDSASPELEIDDADGRPPLLSVFGGRLATSRKLAEQAIDRLRPTLSPGPAWTASATIPGGAFEVDGSPALARALRAAYPFIPDRLAARLVSAYGTRAQTILAGTRRQEDLGRVFGADLTEAEARYLIREEWAQSADDILWRRSKLGLRFSPAEAAGLDDWLAGERSNTASRHFTQADVYGTAWPRSSSGRPIE